MGGDSNAAVVKGSRTERVFRQFVLRRSSKRFLDQEAFVLRDALVCERQLGRMRLEMKDCSGRYHDHRLLR